MLLAPNEKRVLISTTNIGSIDGGSARAGTIEGIVSIIVHHIENK